MASKSNIQVLHLSLPRTGSTSMKAAYEELGLPAYHGFDFFQRPQDQLQFHKAFNAKHFGKGKPYGRKEFDDLLVGWAAVSDSPILGFIDELIEAYPDAKVVLVNRDIDKWSKSFNDTVIPFFSDRTMWVIVNLIEPFQTLKVATLTQGILHKLFDCHDGDSWRGNLKRIYLEHSTKIRERIPKERLLEYELGSGWEPLCSFLGKEVPDKPFPHLNETEDFERFLTGFRKEKLMLGLLFVARFIVALTTIIGAATYFKLF